jgi:hypothetical protein
MILRGGRTRPDPRNPSDPSESEPDPTRPDFFKKIKLTRPDPKSNGIQSNRNLSTI